ncbi:hypothetical protein SAMN02745883_00326 [Caminicella sporogenes DSM 14501]|uniref:Cof subfamily of IIB subfamily of haloacid dehalogenase superfamily/HAD-superfamily hydrolase, subfamily IIB n=1 Tax=Caminicella sporogenes DSM 14501 TaxID=1121266 RepID=A0A1M6LSG5_9FIRM|nr:Cof-type HAD-IIB family hydrolase [Caminicella sporogenes]RKD27933.1 hypothetical protein BET04_02415 [Caminicella sporogenes]WIF94475.1 Cof-type HAD-IIB family hydrolase [Caminicella sporogenes]SHJ74085.1 hypothetical protein SAMN02745883_00326 [Caminicella sporogenes DSM 14501]
MEYKAVITDLDGTLLNSDHKVSDYTKEVIKKVIKKGVKFFIATGRHHQDVSHIRNQLGLNTTFITSNGCRVHDSNEEILLAHDIDESIVRKLLNLEVDKDIHVNIYQNDKWYVSRENDWVKQFHAESQFFYDIVDFNKLEDYKAAKVFYICNDHEKLVLLKEKIEKLFPNKLNVVFSLPSCLEVMPYGVSKGFAIKKVLEKYGIHPKEAIAFGDGLNDYEMLKLVGRGFIMGNAHDKLKEVLPNFEVVETNDENGVANTLKRIFL